MLGLERVELALSTHCRVAQTAKRTLLFGKQCACPPLEFLVCLSGAIDRLRYVEFANVTAKNAETPDRPVDVVLASLFDTLHRRGLRAGKRFRIWRRQACLPEALAFLRESQVFG
ncbi:hypothetical protein ASC76_18155 [Rhizobacter sp. Root404]|nr:hypothetical protein ASC76_18155 [Rhizobacter sp. Root404]